MCNKTSSIMFIQSNIKEVIQGILHSLMVCGIPIKLKNYALRLKCICNIRISVEKGKFRNARTYVRTYIRTFNVLFFIFNVIGSLFIFS